MKLEFRDTMNREAIDLYFEIRDEVDRDITVNNAEIKWVLNLEYSAWGIESFNYELGILLLSIQVETPTKSGGVDSTTLFAEIKNSTKSGEKGYVCRIYEEIMDGNKWEEDEYVRFPIEFIVEEKPATEQDNRAQIFVKYMELDLTSEPKTLKLTI